MIIRQEHGGYHARDILVMIREYGGYRTGNKVAIIRWICDYHTRNAMWMSYGNVVVIMRNIWLLSHGMYSSHHAGDEFIMQ